MPDLFHQILRMCLCTYHVSVCSTCLTHIVFIDVITLMIYGEEWLLIKMF